jgi:hypothetical protein
MPVDEDGAVGEFLNVGDAADLAADSVIDREEQVPERVRVHALYHEPVGQPVGAAGKLARRAANLG